MSNTELLDFMQQKSFQLIETVAHQIAAMIKENYAVASITITVHKPHAIKYVQDIAVIVVR